MPVPFDYSMPFFTATTGVFAVFVASLVAFDLILVRWLKLGKTAWKRVDYIWLGVGVLGILGSVEVPRTIVSHNLLAQAEFGMIWSASNLRITAGFGTSPAICRTFVRSEFSPPEPEFSDSQREYDAVCSWFKSVAKVLPKEPANVTAPIAMESFGPIPATSDSQLRWAVAEFENAVRGANQQLAEIERLRAIGAQTEFESVLRILGPLLLTIAVALRITKVTGELKNEV